MDMDRQKLLNMLGLCRISGNLKSGDAMCEEAIRQRKAELVLIAKDASDNTRKKFKDKASFYKIEAVDLPFDKSEMGKAMGLGERSVAAVTDKGLADSLRQMIHKVMGE